MKVDIAGKALIVTGTASGIGNTIACLAAKFGAESLLPTVRDEAGCLATKDALTSHATNVEIHICNLLSDASAPIGGVAVDLEQRVYQRKQMKSKYNWRNRVQRA